MRTILFSLLLTSAAQGSLITIGPNGINSSGLQTFGGAVLTGSGIGKEQKGTF